MGYAAHCRIEGQFFVDATIANHVFLMFSGSFVLLFLLLWVSSDELLASDAHNLTFKLAVMIRLCGECWQTEGLLGSNLKPKVLL